MSRLIDEIKNNIDTEQVAYNSMSLLVQLYTDYAHFIYELLQNAEDCQATKIKFVMTDANLTVSHDGRPFTSENLKALCNIAQSDKNQINQIGQFGVGFKSVFSVCKEVEVHSNVGNSRFADIGNSESFDIVIKKFINPMETTWRPVFEPFTTVFVLPFSVGEKYNGYKTMDALRRGVSEKLSSLDSNTLLFMKSLKEISYEINTSIKHEAGKYQLSVKQSPKDSKFKRIEAVKEVKNNREVSSYYLFSKPMEIGGIRKTVDLAFSLNSKGDFVPTTSRFVSVYFPTQVESNLKFLIQGPYKTSPDRSNIPFDDADNQKVVTATASLLLDAVRDLRDHDLVTLDFLTLLPLEKNNPLNSDGLEISDEELEESGRSSWCFRELYSITKYLFEHDRIIPTLSGDYSSASNSVIFRGEMLGKLFSDNDLDKLYSCFDRASKPILYDNSLKINESGDDLIEDDYDYHMLIENRILSKDDFLIQRDIGLHKLAYLITETSQKYRCLWFYLRPLGAKTFIPETLCNDGLDLFITGKDDIWLNLFYSFLRTNPELFNRSNPPSKVLLTNRIVKTTNNEFKAPCIRQTEGRKSATYIDNVFLPDEFMSPEVSYVSKSVYEANRDFFEHVLKLKKPDPFDSFSASLRSRYISDVDGIDVDDETIAKDTNNALKWLADREYSGRTKQLLESLDAFLVGKDLRSEEQSFYNVNYSNCDENIYSVEINDPVELAVYFNLIKDTTDESFVIIDEEYYVNNGVDFNELLRLLPLRKQLAYRYSEGDFYYLGNSQCWDVEGFQHDFMISGIEGLLRLFKSHSVSDHLKVIASKYLMSLLEHYKSRIVGYRKVGKVKEEQQKCICDLLRGDNYLNTAWLYTINQTWAKPAQISKLELNSDIYGEMVSDNDFYFALGLVETEESEKYDQVETYKKLDEEIKTRIINEFLMEKYGYEIKEIDEILQRSSSDRETITPTYSFPINPIIDINRLKNHIRKVYSDGIPVAYEERMRRVRISQIPAEARQFASNEYSDIENPNFHFCQMCGKRISHFAIAQLEREPKRELSEMYLSLCYECAYDFRDLRGNGDPKYLGFIEGIKKFDLNQKYEEPIQIGLGDGTVRFTATHLAEIKEVFSLQTQRVDSEQSASDLSSHTSESKSAEESETQKKETEYIKVKYLLNKTRICPKDGGSLEYQDITVLKRDGTEKKLQMLVCSKCSRKYLVKSEVSQSVNLSDYCISLIPSHPEDTKASVRDINNQPKAQNKHVKYLYDFSNKGLVKNKIYTVIKEDDAYYYLKDVNGKSMKGCFEVVD